MEKEIIFPENITSIMEKILEKYERGETIEEAFEKAMNDIKTNGEKLRDVILGLVYNKINLNELPQVLEKEFELTSEKASLMAEDIQREILVHVKKVPVEEKEEEIISKEMPEIKKEAPPEELPKKDIYREPLE